MRSALRSFGFAQDKLGREGPPLRSRERPVLKTVAAYAKDESVRLQFSSGGIFTVLAERVLDDGGVVVGVAQTAPVSGPGNPYLCIMAARNTCACS